MIDFLLPSAIILLLIVINGLFVAAEFAIVAAPYTRIAQRAEAGDHTARYVLSILRDPVRRNHYIATAQVGITIASLGLGMYGEHTIADWLLGPLEGLVHLNEAVAHSVALVLAVAILTYLHVVLGEMVPKSLAIQSAETTVLQVSGSMSLIGRLFGPLVSVLNWAGDAITRMLGVPPTEGHERLFSSEELELIVAESYEGGLLAPAEQLYLENIFDFPDRTVGQVMTPRTRVVGLPASANLDQVREVVQESRRSRYPVYQDNMDQILGTVHIKTLARLQVSATPAFDLQRLLRPALSVPETLSLQEMLTQFQAERTAIAIVVDEYGGTAGIVTVEDLVEEILGEIQDEFDTELPPMQILESGELQVRGDLILDELNQHFDLELAMEGVETVGGLIMAELGRVPVPDDRVTVDNTEFTVTAVEGLAVQTVRVRLPEQTTNPEQDQESGTK